MGNFARICLVAIDVIAELDFNFNRMVNPVGETVSSRNSTNLYDKPFEKNSSFADTDENAFEARDLESDFHDASTTKDPTSHGIYIIMQIH